MNKSISFCVVMFLIVCFALTACRNSGADSTDSKIGVNSPDASGAANSLQNAADHSELLPPYFRIDFSGSEYDVNNVPLDLAFCADMEQKTTTFEIVDCLNYYTEQWNISSEKLILLITPLLNNELQNKLSEEQSAYKIAMKEQIDLFSAVYLQTMGIGTIIPIQSGYASFYQSRQNALYLGEIYFVLTGINYWKSA